MNLNPTKLRRFNSSFGLLAAAFLASTAATALAVRPVPENLGNGLDTLVASNLAVKAGAPAPFNGFATKEAASYAKMALKDAATGRYLVDIMPDGLVPLAALQSSLQTAFPLLTVKNIDTTYRGHGIIEGLVVVDDVAKIARSSGVGSVILQLKPIHNAGQSVAQGVNQHRVNRINKSYNPNATKNIDGTGMSIGVMSDSFDASASTTDRAAVDEAADELPSVVVLEDLALGASPTDEGRGMCQIVHDMAPGATIGFATADVGEVGFANNIRALAGLKGFTKDPSVQKGFKGDVVCDDVSYLDEPMFSDGVIAEGVNDVVAAGVSYASSAANNWGTDGYASTFRPVPNGTGKTAATNRALAGTNIDLTGVDPAVYAGGFHNFNPNGLDVAQTINTSSNAPFVFEWNDPYDVSAPKIIEPPIAQYDGTSTGGQAVDFKTPPLVAGHAYVIREVATPTTPADNFDAIVAVIDPKGHTLVDQDTGTDETVTFFATVDGVYTIHVHPFSTPDPLGVTPGVPTQGPFHVKLNNATGIGRITQDFNVLFFDMSGKLITTLALNNIANNRPIESGTVSFPGNQAQLVICRSNTATPPNAADQLKYVFFGNGLSGIGPSEYGNYLTPVTFGHSAAAGANSVAAYAGFRPNIPEDFTSPGPVTIYFDKNSKRLSTPEVRLKPDVAATDGANTSFFPEGPVPFGGVPIIGDSNYDMDDYPNFYGTSAASPHCASVAALVLQAHGGKRSLTPAQVKTILQTTTFPHDLDPYSVSGTALAANGGAVTVNVFSDNSGNNGTGENDPNSWSVSYTGPGVLTSLHFNPQATPQTGGNPTGGNFIGVTAADYLDSSKYHYTPGMVFTSKFIFGNLSKGLTAGDVSVSRSNPAPPPSNPDPSNPNEHEWTLNLAFSKKNFTSGKVLHFNNGRQQQQDAETPQGMTNAPSTGSPVTNNILRRSGDYSADILGDGVLIPEDPTGIDVRPGMTFSGTVVDGAKTYTFEGRLRNRVGHGYSPLDGFGFINAEAAVAAPVPTATPAVSPGPVQLVNMSGRVDVGHNDDVAIGGFISTGSNAKRVLVRGLGPSLAKSGVHGSLQNPVLELHDSTGKVTINDDWRSSQQAQIQQTGLAPTDDREAAIVATLPAGNNTAILRGSKNTTGVGLVEIYDLEPDLGELGNLSVRASVGAGDNVLIAGLIVRAGDPRNVLLRGLGPELGAHNVAGPLQNPLMELHDANGATLATNDNWKQAPNASAIKATTIPPVDDRESAILMSLGPGHYTAVVRGVNNTTGVGQVEAYKLTH